jgi:hypothetical protein
MTDPDAGTTNPDAEAKALAAKAPAPAGFILGITAAEATNANLVRSLNRPISPPRSLRSKRLRSRSAPLAT